MTGGSCGDGGGDATGGCGGKIGGLSSSPSLSKTGTGRTTGWVTGTGRQGHDSRTRTRESREIALIKLGMLRDNNLLGSWVVKLPTLVPIRVTKEDALLHVRCK
jgi:hypothetical protein